MAGFTFSFSGDDIDENLLTEDGSDSQLLSPQNIALERNRRMTTSAFPIAGQDTLKPQVHSLNAMLRDLPSRISYKTLTINCENGTQVVIPRRELWDIRVQLMAEDDDENLKNLGQSDIKTGIYEGGFKSWESSSDLVKVLYQGNLNQSMCSRSVLELGCGTAFPSLFEFQRQLQQSQTSGTVGNLSIGLADYNPTVLRLVTLPNFILSWAQEFRGMLKDEGELEIDESLVEDFKCSIKSCQMTLSFFSGGWSPEFVRLVSENMDINVFYFIVVGAETIYSPFALKSFTEVILSLLMSSNGNNKFALVAAKTFYFGVGGTMEDFCEQVKIHNGAIRLICEERVGVARAVVEVRLVSSNDNA
ncbi:putative s-adenosylmethionine-dependent methyltransferase-like protein [Erysiphe necator]|uniref:protein-histidine N-methyltransferase n=1 Tax=Uncinula necator TaxID=52586 RepID=A0A0B1P5W6_UNCNE|nr:putative s-adenosylmethionine-dependent methyltransferase-like protein [Erysiphe necator]